MKVTLELTEDDSYETYFHATGYALALWDIQQKIRERLKYADLGEEAYKELDDIYKLVFTTRQEHHLPED
jgi:predicted nucleic acid-binding OB-fold protein